MPVPATRGLVIAPHTVMTLSPISNEIATYTVDAAYFVEDQSYTLFKDIEHTQIAAFPSALILAVSRNGAVRAVTG